MENSFQPYTAWIFPESSSRPIRAVGSQLCSNGSRMHQPMRLAHRGQNSRVDGLRLFDGRLTYPCRFWSLSSPRFPLKPSSLSCSCRAASTRSSFAYCIIACFLRQRCLNTSLSLKHTIHREKARSPTYSVRTWGPTD